MQDSTLVAVYGSLRKEMGNHRLLEDSEYLNTEFSIPEFEMYSLGGFPALLAGEDRAVIELYNVDKDTFARLDMLEGYPTMYDRRQIMTSHGDAWIYFMHKLNWGGDLVEGGDWVEFKARSSLLQEKWI